MLIAKKKSDLGWGCSSVMEHLLSMNKVLGSNPKLEKKKAKW
jgi:hypothetical protein